MALACSLALVAIAALLPSQASSDSALPVPAAGGQAPGAACPAPVTRTRPNRSAVASIRCRALEGTRARVVSPPRHGRLGRIAQRRERVRYFPERGFEGVDSFRIARGRGELRSVTTHRVIVEERESAPRCTDRRLDVNYAEPTVIRVTCRGRGLERLELSRGPSHGDAEVLSESGTRSKRTIRLRHTPEDRYVGSDTLLVDATDRRGESFGAVALDVQPWKMRAFGDSVTAGFGFLGDGTEISVDDVPDCKPTATTLNDRCSSNSDQGPEYDSADPSWSADYGLSNDVAWPAQFADDLQGGGKVSAPVGFQNLGVTGSAPSDWLAGGSLAPTLKDLIADDPDLIVFTLGANPLLDDVLLSEDGEECADEDTVAELTSCVMPFFDQANLEGNLEQIYEGLFAADSAEIVVMQYHLAIPSANLFSDWQLEAVGNLLNSQIESAVDTVKAEASPADAGRLHLVRSQIDPNDPQPDEIARFNIGMPPSTGQDWTAPYDCGWDDYVDGPSHQSDPTQDEQRVQHPYAFCEGEEWVIGVDSGIHPNAAGYAQFASALDAYVTDNDLVPPLPTP